MRIQESAENYLETILILKKRSGHVRSIDIANELSYSKPSVSVAMKNLRMNGYIEMDPDGSITLLDKGREIAEKYSFVGLADDFRSKPRGRSGRCVPDRACYQRRKLSGH